MSYCFNLACRTPHNPDNAKFCQTCGSALLLGDRYRAVGLLGAGGFGRTLLALDEHKPSRPSCVIKQFLPQQQGTRSMGKAAELFHREAIQLEPLGEHPHIPQLYAYFTEGDRQFLVQEYINGQTLTQELAEHGSFSETQIHQLLANLLPTLQFIHDRQVIHRDIKPDNIIRRQEDGQLFLVDFGAAKSAAISSPQHTGTIIGSAAYTAPEQLLGKATYNSDIYSLGVTCLYLLTQVAPFDLFDSAENQWVWKDCLQNPINPQFVKVLDKMINTGTKYRYQSASEILTDLSSITSSLSSPDDTGFAPITQSPPSSSTYHFSSSTIPPIVPTPASETTLQFSDIKTELETALKATLNPYWVNSQLYWGKKHLTLFIIRDPDTPINYTYLVKRIEETLYQFRLNGIETVKIYGRLSDNPMPEWKSLIDLNQQSLWISLAKSKLSQKLSQKLSSYQDRSFWLAQTQKKEFWLDIFLFCLMTFVFTSRIILWHPLLGWITAIAFMAVKTIMRDRPEFQEEKLYQHLVLSGMILGLSHLHFWISDAFALILASLMIASPFFYLSKKEI